MVWLCFLVFIVSASAESDTAPDHPDVWLPVQVNTYRELARLQPVTEQNNCEASCSYCIHKELVDYETAKEKCEESAWIGFGTPGGRRLVSIHSELENRIVWYMFRHAFGEELEEARYDGATNWVWIGLEKENHTELRPNSGKVVWNTEDWRWSDGQTLNEDSYVNWLDKHDEQVQPDMMKEDGQYQTAARLYRRPNREGAWDDTFKTQKHPYVCKFNVPVHYMIFEDGRTWDNAKTACEDKGFYFAKIRSKAENDLFVEAVRIVFGDVRHDKKFHHANWIWIGATDLTTSGEFEFYDGEKIWFTIPWAKKQHDNKTTKKQGSQDHVAVSRWGEWDDSYGNDWERPYACQCSPYGIAVNEEMERINVLWEEESRMKEEAAQRKKAAKEARKERRIHGGSRTKAERKADMDALKEANQAKKQSRKDAMAAKKDANAAKKADRKASKAEKKDANKAKKQSRKDSMAAKKDANAAKKAARKASKAEKKDANKARKDAKASNRGLELQKRQWAPPKRGRLERRAPGGRGRLEKRQWATPNGRKRRGRKGRNGRLEKRTPDHRGRLQKRQWAGHKRVEVEKREQWPLENGRSI